MPVFSAIFKRTTFTRHYNSLMPLVSGVEHGSLTSRNYENFPAYLLVRNTLIMIVNYGNRPSRTMLGITSVLLCFYVRNHNKYFLKFLSF